jgi:hypothetical protein
VNGRIISVPHSGTRSLQKFLGLTAYWHWGLHDQDIYQHSELIHVPIRDPLKVLMSWARRYPNEKEKTGASVLALLDKQIEYTKGRKDTHFYVVEDLPFHIGNGPDTDIDMDHPGVIVIKRWIGDKIDFYRNFYDSFDWMK